MAKNTKTAEDDIQVNTAETTEVTADTGQKETEKPSGEEKDLEQSAGKLMAKERVNTVWYCPKRGYWFVNKELAHAYAKSHNITLKTFEK